MKKKNLNFSSSFNLHIIVIIVDLFYVIFLREHNRRCNELYEIHGDSWSDETYFQEARKWVIALLQKITYYEYGK